MGGAGGSNTGGGACGRVEACGGTGLGAIGGGGGPVGTTGGASPPAGSAFAAMTVTEQVDLPFKSVARSTYNGQDVGVMHACGHDNHVAILMGVAEVLASESPRSTKRVAESGRA